MTDLLALASAKLGQTVDMDGMYGGQCMDLIVYVVQTAYGVHMGGNAIDTGSASNIAALQNAGVKVQRITNRSQLQRGDIVVFSDGSYGHVAIVEEPTHPTLVQQNINGRQYVTRDSFAWSDYYGLSFAYGLRLGDSTPDPDPQPEEEEEMIKVKVTEGVGKGSVGYLYNGRLIVGGGASKDNLTYQMLKNMETAGKIKPIYEEINGDDFATLYTNFPSYKNGK
ncbi:CHAP domain-containing protein [Lactococcus petauri]|uniref:CHAP domain-containing protein n=1 Tax=Lactococcus petauri TaxID=1940789 RepID=UPI00254C074B|nr:CHAP domain-containing protein [Lactococcus petauri]